jgi:hypothetical protein
MKRLLLNSILLCLWLGLVCFSCSDGSSSGINSQKSQDTIKNSRSATGKSVNSQQTNPNSRAKDTTLLYKTEIRNNAPDQSRIDSIKAAKTKKKK